MQHLEKIIITLIMLLIISITTILFANGGPINESYYVSTGNIVLTENKNITLKKENLSIKIDEDYANYEVDYTFKNSGKEKTLTYAFPIDHINYTPEFMSENELENLGLDYFEIKDNGKVLDYNIKKNIETYENEEYVGYYNKYIKDWYITKIKFPANSEKHINVNYRIKAMLDDVLTSKSFFPSYSDRVLIYDLSPSGYWGKGDVSEFNLTIDTRNLFKNNGKIKTIQCNLFDKNDFNLKNNKYMYNSKSFNMKNAGKLEIIYDNSSVNLKKVYDNNGIKKKHFDRLKVSSVLNNDKRYSKNNLFDDDPTTAWVEGVKDYGKWQYVEFKIKNFNAVVLQILNGYTKNKKTYYENNRIKKLMVEISKENYSKEDMKRHVIDLEDKDYSKYNPNYPQGFAQSLIEYGDLSFAQNESIIRIYILDVYKGTKYNDTCISELYILGR